MGGKTSSLFASMPSIASSPPAPGEEPDAAPSPPSATCKSPAPAISTPQRGVQVSNEMSVALNSGERHVLAIVAVGAEGFVNEPIYVRKHSDGSTAPDFSATIFRFHALPNKGTRPC